MAHEAGKGSGRRKEDASKVRDNWDLIFGSATKKEKSKMDTWNHMDAIHTALAYSKILKDRQENYQKPVVFFIGTPLFDTTMFDGHEVAHVRTINHPAWGSDKVRTSSIVKKNDDGSFETMNTLYKPYTEPQQEEPNGIREDTPPRPELSKQ